MTQSTFAPSLQSVSHFASGNGVAAALKWAALEWSIGHGHSLQSHLHRNLQPDDWQSDNSQPDRSQSDKLQRHKLQRYGWQYPRTATSGMVSMPVFLPDGMVRCGSDLAQDGADGLAGYQSDKAVALWQTGGRYRDGITVLTH